MDSLIAAAALVAMFLGARRRQPPTPERPYRYTPRLAAALIPDSAKPIALNEYGLPERVFVDPAIFPLRYGDLGDLVRDYQVATNWKGGADGQVVPETGFFDADMIGWVSQRTGHPHITLDDFRAMLADFPPLAEVHTYEA